MMAITQAGDTCGLADHHTCALELFNTLDVKAKALDYALEVSSRPRQSGNNSIGGVQKACKVQ